MLGVCTTRAIKGKNVSLKNLVRIVLIMFIYNIFSFVNAFDINLIHNQFQFKKSLSDINDYLIIIS
jgi:hypothetical protein